MLAVARTTTIMSIDLVININDNSSAFTGKQQWWCSSRFMPVKSDTRDAACDCGWQKGRVTTPPSSRSAALFPWPLKLLGLSVEMVCPGQQLCLESDLSAYMVKVKGLCFADAFMQSSTAPNWFPSQGTTTVVTSDSSRIQAVLWTSGLVK